MTHYNYTTEIFHANVNPVKSLLSMYRCRCIFILQISKARHINYKLNVVMVALMGIYTPKEIGFRLKVKLQISVVTVRALNSAYRPMGGGVPKKMKNENRICLIFNFDKH